MRDRALVVCIGTPSEVGARIVASAGGDASVLMVPDVPDALRVLRGGHEGFGGTTDEVAIRFGPLRLDSGAREAYWRERPIALSARQFDLLTVLALDGDRVWSYAELTQAVWRRAFLGDVDAVASAVKRLRRRIAEVTSELTIASVRGVGYRLALLPGRGRDRLRTAPPRVPRRRGLQG
ncbi:MAG TPA: winged helix-turn-helix domain-containing protein [Actinopolymorphaceae bacterium]